MQDQANGGGLVALWRGTGGTPGQLWSVQSLSCHFGSHNPGLSRDRRIKSQIALWRASRGRNCCSSMRTPYPRLLGLLASAGASLLLPGFAEGSFHPQQGCDFPFKDRDVSSANVLGIYTAVAVDQQSHRQSQNSSVKFASRGVAHHYRIIHLEMLVEVADRFRPIVHGNANNL